MMKRLLAMLLVFVMAFSLLPVSAFAEGEAPEEKSIEEPTVTDEPVVTEEPTPTEEPTATDEPVPTEEPVEQISGEDDAKLMVYLDFAADSELGSDDIGDIRVVVLNRWTGDEVEGVLSNANGRKAEFRLPSGEYYISVYGNWMYRYDYTVTGDNKLTLSDGEEVSRRFTINYQREKGTLRVALDFDYASELSGAGIDGITVTVSNLNTWETPEPVVLSNENGWSAEFSVAPGPYRVSFSDYDVEGYSCDISGEYTLDVYADEETAGDFTACYTRDEATLFVSLDFAGDSLLGDEEVGAISVDIYKGRSEIVGSAILTRSNGRTAEFNLPSGSYRVYFSNYEQTGYSCSIEGETEFYLYAGDYDDRSYTAKYTRDEAKLRFSLNFAGDSLLGDEDIGDITLHLRKDGVVIKTVKLSSENGRTAGFTLTPGNYYYKLSGYGKSGYSCNLNEKWSSVYLYTGDEISRELTARYLKSEAKLNVSLGFQDSSLFKDEDIGDITVSVADTLTDESAGSAVLKAGDRNASFTLQPGNYCITFSGYEKEGYTSGLYESYYVTLAAGNEISRQYKLNYREESKTGIGKLRVTLGFASDSALADKDAGDITLYIEHSDTGEMQSAVLSYDNGRTAEFTVPSGWYWVWFGDYDEPGYLCDMIEQDATVRPDEETSRNYTIRYEKDEATINYSLSFAEDSLLKAGDIGELELVAKKYYGNGEYSVKLNEENNYSVRLTVSSGYYSLYLNGTEVEGYDCLYSSGSGGSQTIDLESGDEVNVSEQLSYQNWGTLDFSMVLPEGSEVTSADVGDVEIYMFSEKEDSSGNPLHSRTILLTEENGRKARLSLPAGFYDYKVSGAEVEGYYLELSTDRDGLFIIRTGQESSETYEPVYYPTDYEVSIVLEVDEDSELSGEEISNKYRINFGKVDFPRGNVDDITTTLEAGEDKACVIGGLIEGEYSIRSPRSTDERTDIELKAVYVNGEERNITGYYYNFDIGAQKKNEVRLVVSARREDVTITGRLEFSEDSQLQKEDFPEGLYLSLGGYGFARVGEHNNWTYTFSGLPYGKHALSVEQVPGYDCICLSVDETGNAAWSTESIDYNAEKTVTLTVDYQKDFPEETRVLHIHVAAAEDSSLDLPQLGSLDLSVKDGSAANVYELSEEKGWDIRVPISNAFSSAYGFTIGEEISATIAGRERDGYSCTVTQQNPGFWERHSSSWAAGREIDLYYTLDYRANGKSETLIVKQTGSKLEAEIRVEDAAGNVVGRAQLNPENDYCHEFPLDEEGEYVVYQELAAEPEVDRGFFCAAPEKRVYFNPAVGAVVEFRNEELRRDEATIRLYFADDSELRAEDFPDGVQLKLVHQSSGEVFTVTLSEENGWYFAGYLAEGSYNIQLQSLEKSGYVLSVSGSSYNYSSWDAIPMYELSKEFAWKTGVTEIGPFQVISMYDGCDNDMTLRISGKALPNGSLTITADDLYAVYGGEGLGDIPGSGYEAADYTYTLVCGDYSETFTLAPGGSKTIDNLPVGAEYTVTAQPPEGYAWNIPAVSYSGTVPAQGEEGGEIEMDNDYFYIFAEPVSMKVLKLEKGGSKALEGAEFGLYADSGCTQLVSTAVSDKNGLLSFSFTEAGTWYLKELKAPDGYKLSGTVYPVTVSESWVKDVREDNGEEVKVIVQQLSIAVSGLTDEGGWLYGIENEPLPPVTVSVTKVFKNDEKLERPDFVEITLYQDGKPIAGVKLSEENNWSYKWKDLPGGHEYTVDERVPKGYVRIITRNGNDFVVTNVASYPATGDSAALLPWAFMAMLSLCGAAMLIRKLRRKENE